MLKGKITDILKGTHDSYQIYLELPKKRTIFFRLYEDELKEMLGSSDLSDIKQYVGKDIRLDYSK